MEDVTKLLQHYLARVPGLLAILVADREGVPVVRVTTNECPESALRCCQSNVLCEPVPRPAFLGTGFNGQLAEQASKLGVGGCQGMVAVYQSHQVDALLPVCYIVNITVSISWSIVCVRSWWSPWWPGED